MAPSRRACLSLIATLAVAAPVLALAQVHPLPRRGDYLPQAVLQQGPVANYGALRLRKPPVGYGWYQIGHTYVMANEGTGLIVEVVAL